jgi:hypothetical protein
VAANNREDPRRSAKIREDPRRSALDRRKRTIAKEQSQKNNRKRTIAKDHTQNCRLRVASIPSTITPLIVPTTCFAEKGARGGEAAIVLDTQILSFRHPVWVIPQKLAFRQAVSVWHHLFISATDGG